MHLREKEIGSIEVGKWADLCNYLDLYKNLFYSVGEHPVLNLGKGVKKFSLTGECGNFSMDVGEKYGYFRISLSIF